MSRLFIATIKNGKLELGSDYARSYFVDFLKQNEGKKLRIELAKNPVSDELRGYYFGAVMPTVKSAIKEWKKLDPEEAHEILKKMFNYFDAFNPITKRVERYGRSAMSDGSNSSRAMDFIDKIRVWLAEEYLVDLPTPDEYKKTRDSAPLKN